MDLNRNYPSFFIKEKRDILVKISELQNFIHIRK